MSDLAFKVTYSLLAVLTELDRGLSDKDADPTSVVYLKWMCHRLINNNESWDEGKKNRWIGYIQGVMVAKGWTTVEKERDRVRWLAKYGGRESAMLGAAHLDLLD